MSKLKTFYARSPEGERIAVLLPDDATDDQIIAEGQRIYALNNRANVSDKKPLIDKRSPLEKQLATDPTVGMSSTDLALAGTGKAIADTGMGIRQLVGKATSADVKEMRKRDRPLMARGAAQVGNVVGGLGVSMLPGGVARAGVPLARAAGSTRGGDMLQALSAELLSPSTISGGVGQGAAYGAIQPSVSPTESSGNALVGGMLGGAFPAITRGVKVGAATLEPFSERGKASIIARLLDRMAGDEAPAVRERIRDAVQPTTGPFLPGEEKQYMGQLVPGSFPSVAEIAMNPGVASLQRAATATEPAVMNRMAAQRAANEEARVSAVKRVAGDDGRLDWFKTDRDNVANMLYEDARKNGYPPEAVTPEIAEEISQLLSRPSIKEGMARAKFKAAEQNAKLDDDNSIMGLDYVRRSLSDQIESAKRSGHKDDARLFTATLEKLDNVLHRLSPDYAKAVGTFAEMSKPINAMEAAADLLRSSQNPMTGNLYPLKYHRNLSDEGVSRALGRKGATLEKTFPPHDLQTLRDVGGDLAAQSYADTAGRGVGSDTVQKLAFSNLIDSAGIPTFLRALPLVGPMGRGMYSMGEQGAQVLYGRANREMSQILAEALANPAVANELLNVPPSKIPFILQALPRAGASATLAAPGAISANR